MNFYFISPTEDSIEKDIPDQLIQDIPEEIKQKLFNELKDHLDEDEEITYISGNVFYSNKRIRLLVDEEHIMKYENFISSHVNVTRLNNNFESPTYATNGSVGFDFVARNFIKAYALSNDGDQEISKSNIYTFDPNTGLNERLSDIEGELKSGTQIVIPAYSQALFGTNEKYEIPEGFEIQIRPRSGISLKRGLIIMLGTIDHKNNFVFN
jgi:dUTPase